MEPRLPLFSSSLVTTSLLDTSNVQCSQFTTSDNHSLSKQHDRTDMLPLQLSPPIGFIPQLSASWKLTRQLCSMDSTSWITTSPPSTVDDHWFHVSDTALDDEHPDDYWSIVSAASKKLTDIKEMAPIELVLRYMSTRPVLQNPMAEKIRAWLPRRVAASQQRWKLLYSLDQHGASIETFYHRVVDQGPCLLVIQDDDDNLFGAFISESMRIGPSFYGSGESFLWRRKLLTLDGRQTDCLEHYPWTTKNSYFIYSDKTLIGFGNGTGQFGLCLDEGIENGTTCPCPTYDNPCLTPSAHFKCIGLEVWSVS